MELIPLLFSYYKVGASSISITLFRRARASEELEGRSVNKGGAYNYTRVVAGIRIVEPNIG